MKNKQKELTEKFEHEDGTIFYPVNPKEFYRYCKVKKLPIRKLK